MVSKGAVNSEIAAELLEDLVIQPSGRFAAWVRTAGFRHGMSAVLTAVPIIAVNIVAFIGQYAYLRDHLPVAHGWIVLVALTLESIAVGLAYQAHLAQVSNDATARIRGASYLLALVIGGMNYSHFADHWRPTVAALTFGLMSSISPWLWATHSRRVSRDKLMAQGLIEPHAVRLGTTRAAWHPVGWVRVMRRATWLGTTSPQEAIDDYMEHGPVQIRAARQDAAPRQPRQGNRAAPPPAVPVAQEPAPEVARQAAPAIEAAAVPVPRQAPARPAPAGAPVTPPAVHHAEAHLAAESRIPEGVSDERVQEAEEWLAGLPVDELPAGRAVARFLSESSDQRRLAGRLLTARRAAESQKPASRPVAVPAAGNGHGGELIATPRQFIPGGVAVG